MGELVRTLPVGSVGSGRLVDFRVDGPAAGGATGLQFQLKDEAGIETPWAWDGLNDQGSPVDSGVYTVRLIHHELGQRTEIKTERVTLLKSPDQALADLLASALVAPNPLTKRQSTVQVAWAPSAGYEARVRVYNLASELVAQGAGLSSDGKIEIDVLKLSGGVYMVDLQFYGGTRLVGRRALKLAILQ